MFRVIVGVLAAFVGFSFGHSIPKWIENKGKSASVPKTPSPPEQSHPIRRMILRRKPLRKFKFGAQKSGKDTATDDSPLNGVNPAPNQPLSVADLDNYGRTDLDTSVAGAFCADLRVKESDFSRISSQESVSSSPTREKNQVKRWKNKLMSLKSKAMASEKIWYEKFEVEGFGGKGRRPLAAKAMEGEGFGGKISAPSPKVLASKLAKGKENELLDTRSKDPYWGRNAASGVHLLFVEGPKSNLER